MLPNDNVSRSVGHLDHVLIVYSSMEDVTWKSPGPMCGWVGRILHPDSCTSVSSWSRVPLVSIWSVAVTLCPPLLPCPSRWHGSLPRHGLWWLTCELHCYVVMLCYCWPWYEQHLTCQVPQRSATNCHGISHCLESGHPESINTVIFWNSLTQPSFTICFAVGYCLWCHP